MEAEFEGGQGPDWAVTPVKKKKKKFRSEMPL